MGGAQRAHHAQFTHGICPKCTQKLKSEDRRDPSGIDAEADDADIAEDSQR